MPFLHPEYLWLAPLVAAPIIIHLLNRIRYRRVRWAAMEFLLAGEKRAVRRARLRQILLMALRTLLLAAALLALLQPIVGSSLARLLGEGARVAILLDASASMSAGKVTDSAFTRGRKMAEESMKTFPSGTRVMAGTFAVRYDTPFREPLGDREAVAAELPTFRRTAGAADAPRAIRSAAKAMGRSGRGGAIWILTDMQAGGWRANDAGAWEKARRALKEAGDPRVAVSDLSSDLQSNFSVAGVKLKPAIPVAGDSPRLTATISLRGRVGGETSAALFFDGRRVDSRQVKFNKAGRQDVVFRLPALKAGAHVGRVHLGGDGLPADDVYYFAMRTETGLPVLVVDGARATRRFGEAGDFLALAIQPPAERGAQRSTFAVKRIQASDVAGARLRRYAAVFLADVERLTPGMSKTLKAYVERGGLLVVFPGSRTRVAEWRADRFPGVAIGRPKSAGARKIKVNWVAPNSPITASLPVEGLDRLLISRLFPLDAGEGGETLASADDGHAFLTRKQWGKGMVYFFAVSAHTDFSNLPFTPVFLPTMHRIVLGRLVEVSSPLALPAFSELRAPLAGKSRRALTPDGRVEHIRMAPEEPGWGVFDGTSVAGVYRLTEAKAGSKPKPGQKAGPILAAVNPPESESILERIGEEKVRDLLRGRRVVFLGRGGGRHVGSGANGPSAASAFPLAATALAFLIGEALLAWSMDRPRRRSSGDDDRG